MWTCTACRLEFELPGEQKEHFRSDWHRYNLKRKVVELPPVTEEQFNQRMQKVVAEKQAQIEKDPKQKQLKKREEMAKAGVKTMTKCVPCNKTFSNANAFENHLSSKKHLANAKQKPDVANAVATITKKLEVVGVDAAAQTTEDADGEDDENENAGEPTMTLEEFKKQVPLAKEDCIFCAHRAEDFESCLSHMLKEHGFFIPDVEYLTDLEGLVAYLAEKVKLGHFCLYCNGKGKTFHNYHDVQKHMTALSHCKLLYEADEDMEELLDFYDFSAQYTKKERKQKRKEMAAAADEEVEWETDSEAEIGDDEEVVEDEVEEEASDEESEEEDDFMGVSETGELVLANGRRVGQREFRRYYRQRFRPEDERVSVARATKERLLLSYSLAGVDASAGSTALSTAFVANFMKRHNVSGWSHGIGFGGAVDADEPCSLSRTEHCGRYVDCRSQASEPPVPQAPRASRQAKPQASEESEPPCHGHRVELDIVFYLRTQMKTRLLDVKVFTQRRRFLLAVEGAWGGFWCEIVSAFRE
jgi:pre-60S factor REI1